MAAETDGPPVAPKVKCPGCGTLCLFAPANKWRPFCSERCRNLDLGAWASERYRVHGANGDTSTEAEGSGDTP